MRAITAIGLCALVALASWFILVVLFAAPDVRTDDALVRVATLASLSGGASMFAGYRRVGGGVAIALGLALASFALLGVSPAAHAALAVALGALVAALGVGALITSANAAGSEALARTRAVGVAVMGAFASAALLVPGLSTSVSVVGIALAAVIVIAGVALSLSPEPATASASAGPLVPSIPPPAALGVEPNAKPRLVTPAIVTRPAEAARAGRQAIAATVAASPFSMGAPSMPETLSAPVGSSQASSGAPSAWLREIARAPSVRIAPAPPADDPLIGATIGPYKVVSELGRGGMSIVYRAVAIAGASGGSGREVALKILPPTRADDHVYRSRFLREIAAMSGLDHPNIVRVFDASSADAPVFYLAMEIVTGPSLRSRIAAAPGHRLPTHDALAILRAVAAGLGSAHARGVVHRDVKPENILLGANPADAKVADFGLARVDLRNAAKGATALTMAGDVLGTLAYMGPEQLRGERSTAATDVFACGLVFGEMLTGVPLIGRMTNEDTMRALGSFRGAPEALRAPEFARVFPVVDRCLRLDPRERYADGMALERAIGELGVTP